LKPCPACGKDEGELKKSEFGARFPHYAKCKACALLNALLKKAASRH
jgi:hypothetical protein